MCPSYSGIEPDSGDTDYLSDLSPKDKLWDTHKKESLWVRDLYRGTVCDRYSQRIDNCGGILVFTEKADLVTGDQVYKLKIARFCRVRHCPVCQWRKQMAWRARFFDALPLIRQDYPTARFIFMVLTVKTCPLDELRDTLTWMNKSWELLSKRKVFPAIGWLKTVEVTRSKDDYAHPHFNALMMVPPNYFSRNYLSHERWRELWRDCLKVNYLPQVNVQAIKPAKDPFDQAAADHLMKSLCETIKYSVKPSDLIGDPNDSEHLEFDRDWLLRLTGQLHKTRAVAVGGAFRKYISDREPDSDEELTHPASEEDALFPCQDVWFGWREAVARYYRLANLDFQGLKKDG